MSLSFAGTSLLEVWVPLWIEELGPATRRIEGVLQFHLAGHDEVRSWYVDFGLSPPVVIEAIHPSADLVITLLDEHVMPLLQGTLDVEGALAAGTIALEGDGQILERWIEVSSAQMSGMRTLYASTRSGPEPEDG